MAKQISKLNHFVVDGYYFEDSEGIAFQSIDLLYKRSKIAQNISIAADVGTFFIKSQAGRSDGFRYGGTVFYGNFSLRLGINKYSDFFEFVPTLKYHNIYKKNSYTLEYKKQNALFYTFSLTPYEKKIIAHHFSLSDFISFENKMDLWSKIELDLYGNNDKEVTGQFDLTLYKSTIFTQNFTYDFAMDGWYTSHTKDNNDFYSPSFADASLFRFDPKYIFSKYFGIRAKLGIGYSFSDKNTPYKYGLWAFGEPSSDFSYSFGCLRSNTAKISSKTDYQYMECDANLRYIW